MVEGDTVDGHEMAKIVLVGKVVPTPGDNIKWRMVLQSII
jgi:hypothetical protein